MSHSKVIEATVGQNVSLPFNITYQSDLKLVHVEWTRNSEENEITKLAVYSPTYGLHPYWNNVSMQIETSDSEKLITFHLILHAVKKWYSGIYICDISTFPLGSIRRQVVLQIKGEYKHHTTQQPFPSQQMYLLITRRHNFLSSSSSVIIIYIICSDAGLTTFLSAVHQLKGRLLQLLFMCLLFLKAQWSAADILCSHLVESFPISNCYHTYSVRFW